jgi:hypothetical protein
MCTRCVPDGYRRAAVRIISHGTARVNCGARPPLLVLPAILRIGVAIYTVVQWQARGEHQRRGASHGSVGTVAPPGDQSSLDGSDRAMARIGVRRVPKRSHDYPAGPSSSVPAGPSIRVHGAVASPGDWEVPPGARPGGDWLPEPGARPRLRAMPWWVRVWYRTPFLDRCAYQWMWWHGGWGVLTDRTDVPPPAAGRPQR